MHGNLADALAAPPRQACDRLAIAGNEVFIAAPGFEERSRAALRLIEAKPGARAILLDYRPLNPKNDVSGFASDLRRSGISDIEVIQYARFTPDEFPSRIREQLREANVSTALVDTSSMSRLAIMLVLQACTDLGLNVRVHYAEAQHYGPSKEQFEQQKLLKSARPRLDIYTGVHGCVRVASLSSVAMQGQPSAAITFMSFDERLTQALLNTVYPSRLLMINGRPPELRWREAATAWIHEQLRREWDEDNPVQMTDGILLPSRSSSTLDYRETLAILLKLYWALYVDHRILIAPTGSKMQTVACFLAKALHRDIHIEYPTPEAFVDHLAPSAKDQSLYSEGVGQSWVIDFGVLREWIAFAGEIERRHALALP